ncbi:sensor histidine kinase, partial [Streptomyces sp. NPDC059082]
MPATPGGSAQSGGGGGGGRARARAAPAPAPGTPLGLPRVAEERPLAPPADHAAHRLVQEALTNAYKHAPGSE